MADVEKMMAEFFDKNKDKPNGEQEGEQAAEAQAKPDGVDAGREGEITDVWGSVVGKHFKTPEEFNAFYENAAKWKEENEKLVSVLAEVEDPTSYFSSPENYKREQLLKKRPDISVDVADRIVKSDLKAMTPVEKLELEMLLENPDIKGGLDGVKELIKDRYGLEDGDEIPRHIENKILIDSKSAERKLEEVRMDLKDLEKKDYKAIYEAKRGEYESQVQHLGEVWSNAYGSLEARTREFKVTGKAEDGKETEVFAFQVPEDYHKNERDSLIKTLVNVGVNPESEEGMHIAERIVRGSYLAEHWDDVLRALVAETERRTIEKQARDKAGMGSPDRIKPDNQGGNGGTGVDWGRSLASFGVTIKK